MNKYIDKKLLQFVVPPEIITAEKVAEKILGKKIPLKKKQSTKLKAAIKNYRTAITRHRRAETLLEKNYKLLKRQIKKSNLHI